MTKEERTLRPIKTQLTHLDSVLPGSLSTQWNVWSTPGCRCKDPLKPKKHGPYHQLSFTVAGKSSTLFIPKKNLAEDRRRLKRFQRWKKLTTDWVQAEFALARCQGFGSRA